MNRSLLVVVTLALLGVLGFAAARAGAQPSSPAPQHKIVFELTSDSPDVWDGLLNNVENAQKALGKEPTRIEVVAHGKGLALLVVAKNAPARDRLKTVAGGGVVFAACENSMRKAGVKKEELAPFAITVDSGVAEVVRKQEAGSSYIRTGG